MAVMMATPIMIITNATAACAIDAANGARYVPTNGIPTPTIDKPITSAIGPIAASGAI